MFCFSDTVEAAPVVARPRSDTATSTNGRVLRILIVGPDDEKQLVLDDMRSMYGGGGTRAVSVGTAITHVDGTRRSPRFARDPRSARTPRGAPAGGGFAAPASPSRGSRQMVIFNMVPARDLDAPRASSDFEAYIPVSSGAVILVDATADWAASALAWSRRIADVKRMPVVLLINKVGVVPLPPDCQRTYEGLSAALRDGVERFVAGSASPSVGCFFRARGDLDLDSTIDSVAHLMEGIDEFRKSSRVLDYSFANTDGDTCGFLPPGQTAGCFAL